MYVINRAIAIIKPKQPFVDWANSLPDPTPITLEELRSDSTAILIPEPAYQADAEAYIRSIAGRIFEMELDAWHRDPRQWPKKRDYKTFTDWFEVEVFDMVVDAVRNEIIREVY